MIYVATITNFKNGREKLTLPSDVKKIKRVLVTGYNRQVWTAVGGVVSLGFTKGYAIDLVDIPVRCSTRTFNKYAIETDIEAKGFMNIAFKQKSNAPYTFRIYLEYE